MLRWWYQLVLEVEAAEPEDGALGQDGFVWGGAGGEFGKHGLEVEEVAQV
jgi:hypothetical protein